jgi:hypothetical protein
MNNKSAKKPRLRFILLTFCILSMGVSAAFAGEITGNGKSLKQPDGTLHGRSACAFSGREDEPGDPLFRGLIAQSWGQINKAVRDMLATMGLHPGTACNPTRAGGEP